MTRWSYREIREVLRHPGAAVVVAATTCRSQTEHRQAMAHGRAARAAARAEIGRVLRERRRAELFRRPRVVAYWAPRGRRTSLGVAGIVASWAEGAKNKPWRAGAGVKFLNSDPGLILLFLPGCASWASPPDRLVFRVADPRIRPTSGAAPSSHWSDVVGVPVAEIAVIPEAPQPADGAQEHRRPATTGCLCVSVRRSSEAQPPNRRMVRGLGGSGATRLMSGR